jgi:tetratricopeptide (TPR) repeat protein
MEAGRAETNDDLSWLERACLGQDLPPAAEYCLQKAAKAYGTPDEAERLLHQALSLAPQHAAVYIAFYRFHFYRGRLKEALPYAELCLSLAAQEMGLERDWRQVAPGGADFGGFAAYGPRFFLFSLKAYGYLHMRLGNLEEGRRAVEKVIELDPRDQVGASVLLGVLERGGRDDDD